MKTVDEMAVDLFNALPINNKANMFKCVETIKTALVERDKITRHACAENVTGLISRNSCDNCGANYACESCVIKAIINTKSV